MTSPATPTPALTLAPDSTTIAADPALFPVWDRAAIFPAPEDMLDPAVITHVTVERAQPGGYHYLHETSLASHRGKLHLCWANHPTHETNIADELIRGTTSADGGLTWQPPSIIAAPPLLKSESFNHPVLFTHDDTLRGFFTNWVGGPDWRTSRSRSELFRFDDHTGAWQPECWYIPGFLPFQAPLKMRDGNWIMAGEVHWYDAAVAISKGDDLTRWTVVKIPKPDDMELRFPETALIDHGDRLLAICRPRGMRSAPVSESRDCGLTWTPLQPSNLPLAGSQPCAGRLSDGRHYLITNNLESGRTLLSIALTGPDERLFNRIWKIRHQKFPRRRLFPGAEFEGVQHFNALGKPTEWSYPSAVEHNGNLCISYTQGKEDCALSIIPLRVLSRTLPNA
ncbi:hypothetical protein OPIT5_09210 [Opitutaceae bacterium TAV5]|nr:hypothetical protein OPIT5_09210 [Opitutaceae bacterium TAV5]